MAVSLSTWAIILLRSSEVPLAEILSEMEPPVHNFPVMALNVLNFPMMELPNFNVVVVLAPTTLEEATLPVHNFPVMALPVPNLATKELPVPTTLEEVTMNITSLPDQTETVNSDLTPVSAARTDPHARSVPKAPSATPQSVISSPTKSE